LLFHDHILTLLIIGRKFTQSSEYAFKRLTTVKDPHALFPTQLHSYGDRTNN